MRGDKLRRIIFYVYLHNQFSDDKIKVADLKKIIGYSPGGVYSALESKYLERKNDEITLTEEGEAYAKSKLLSQFDTYKSVGTLAIAVGVIFILQWIDWTFSHITFLVQWYFAVAIIVLGVFLRFFVMRFSYFMMKRRKKIE
jgi:hypothetical protein